MDDRLKEIIRGALDIEGQRSFYGEGPNDRAARIESAVLECLTVNGYNIQDAALRQEVTAMMRELR